MRKLVWIISAILITLPLQSMAFAESTYDVNIPSGSADENSPFHWSSEKDGDASGFIEIIKNDTISWKNGDTTAHTVTSGNPIDGPDGVFDSGMIESGKLFVQKFTELGEFPYYCTLHPWRTGLVSVGSGYSVLPNVGSDFSDGINVFDIEYKFNRLVNHISIDESSKSLSLELKGNTINENNTLTLFLPTALISGISSVSIDGIMTDDFSQGLENDFTILVINEVPPSAKSIVLTGTTIVPEFGTISVMILAIAIISIVIISSRSKLGIMPRI